MWVWILLTVIGIVHGTDPYAGRPRIIVEDGNLVIMSASNHNITFRSYGSGHINVNDADLGKLVETIQSSVTEMEQLKAVDLGSFTSQLQRLQDQVEGMNNMQHAFLVLEERVANLTRQMNQMGISGSSIFNNRRGPIRALGRKVRKLETDVQEIREGLDTNECNSNPCQNGGTCVDNYKSFYCRCPPNWKGLVCSEDVNECAIYIGTDLGCQNGGTCYNHEGGYRCQCPVNWFGIHCTEQHDDCSHASEEALCGHGKCINKQRVQPGEARYDCICDQGWTKRIGSAPCDIDIDECTAQQRYPCSQNPLVACINIPGSVRCGPCPTGYSGDGFLCVDINECELNNGGCSVNPRVDCTNTVGSRTCGPCPEGYVGDGTRCIYVGFCYRNNGGCHPQATCTENTAIGNSFRECRCPNGYVGNGVGPTGCVAQTTTGCSPNPCIHGACTISNSQAVCLCYAGYTGALCEQQVNECSNNPCKNGGTCTDQPTGFMCTCLSTWQGRTCEEQTEGCGGKLTDLAGSIVYPTISGQSLTDRHDCAWLIETTPGKALDLFFESFQLQPSRECVFNFLQLHDGSSAGAHLLGRFCSQPPGQQGRLITTHHQVYLWYHADRDISGSSFKLNWNTTEPVCGGTLEGADYGNINSPGYPGRYPADRDCYWTVQVALGKRIQFQFATLNIELHENCSFDFLQIRDGQREVDPVLRTYCSTQTPEPLETSGPFAWLHFHTDNSINDIGFHITYSAVAVPGCGGLLTRDRGVIVSPNFPDPYHNRMICDWLIRVHPEDKIQLDFSEFLLEHQSDCQWDFVEIRDGENEFAPLKGRYCGSSIPQTVFSSSNKLWIQFRSDGSTQLKGFKATYITACGGIYTGTEGVIKSPYYPDPYPTDRTCHYRIHLPQGHVVNLQFEDFSIEGQQEEEGCPFDYLEVRDGGSQNGTVLAKLCGTGLPEPIRSSYNRLHIIFQSDGSVQNRGFKANFSAIDIGCGGVLTDPRGSFSSPSHPNLYPPGTTCNWILRAEPGFIVRLTFSAFVLEEHVDCQFDYVEVKDGDGQFVRRFCGSRIPPSITSTGNVILVSFVTDTSVAREGFEAAYVFLDATQMCGGTFLSDYGVVRSPRFPQSYPPHRDCTWVLHAQTGHQIRLNVTFFHLEQHQNCNFDFLEIRNGGIASSPLVGKYCGQSIPQGITSHSNLLFLHFHSDPSLTAPGFEILYDGLSSGCGGILTSPTGSVVSPHYPEPYSHNALCAWRVQVAEGSLVSFVIVDVDIESHSSCNYDYIRIYDGPNAQAKRMVNFCSGQQNPGPLNSTTNEIFIQFGTDSSQSGRGFHLSYHSTCNTVLGGLRGAIASPNFPGLYPHNYNCTWKLRAPLGNNISLAFSHLLLEHDEECRHDYVEIFQESRPNAASQSVTSLVKHCGNMTSLPPTLNIDSNQAFVRFISDGSVASDGFRLEYSVKGCGGEIRKSYGEFTSPNYPDGYPTLTTCVWVLIVDPGQKAMLYITDVDIEGAENCRFDYIKVYGGGDNKAPLLFTTCSRSDESYFVSSESNRLYVVFHSDVTLGGKGFKAHFYGKSGGCGGYLRTDHSTILSPNYPASYGKYVYCEWKVLVSENHLIQFNVEEFQLPEDDNCTRNYLKVYDGNYETFSALLLSLCGTNPGAVTSTSNRLLIRLLINSTQEDAKPFKFSYVQTCGATIYVTGRNYLSSPGYPHNQYKHFNCTWILQNPEPDGHVTLTFTNMRSLNSDNCTDHYIEIRAGDSSTSQLVNRFCGSRLPAQLTSYGDSFYIHAQNAANFRLVYSPSSSACGGELEAMEGTINSPWYPDSYPPSTDCEWTIRAAPGNKVQLSFSFFELEESDYCSGDFVEIRSSGKDGPLLGRHCGSRRQFGFNSTSEAEVLWVLFRSDEEGPGRGFQADFSLVHGVYLEGRSGEIGSPLYPNMNYLSGDYGWTITVPSGSYVSISFTVLDLENYSEICNNFVEIHDGSDTTANSLGKFCTRKISENPLVTSTNVAYIHFVSEGFYGDKWFITWNAANQSYIATSESSTAIPGRECGGELYVNRSSFSIVQAPNYPYGYFPNQNCTWILMTAPTRHLVLNFTDLNIEHLGDCYADALEVYDGIGVGGSSWSLLRKLCGRQQDLRISANSSLVKLFLTTDSSVEHSGFQINVTEECGSLLYGPSGVLRTEDMLVSDPQTEICQWVIQVRRGRTIQLTFDQFNVPSNGLCSTQYVQFFNGGSVDSPYLGDSKYCGQNIPSVPTSSSHRVRVRVKRMKYEPWQTNEPTPTFTLRYQELSLGCGGPLVLQSDSPSAEITSPGYPKAPPHDIECSWVITSPVGTSIGFHLDILLLNMTNCQTWNEQSHDYVDIYDGGTEHSPRLARFCRNDTNSFHTTGNILLVRFMIGHDNQNALFKASLTIGKCGGIIKRGTEILIPGFPGNYEDNLECEWTLQVDDLLWRIDIEHLTMQESPNCTNDSLEIRAGDKTGDLIGRYCGETRYIILPSSGNPNVYMKFKSDASVNEKAFRIHANPEFVSDRVAGCHNRLETPSGVITSPNYPEAVTVRTFCYWTISAPRGRRITVTFTDFNIPADVSGNCVQGLQVEGGLLRVHSQVQICGTTLPEPIQSISSNLHISFQIAMLSAGEGFRAEYNTDLEAFCGGDLPLPTGIFQLPSITSINITSHLFCTWRITEHQGRNNATLVIVLNELVTGNVTDNCGTANFYGSHEGYYQEYHHWHFNLCGNFSGSIIRKYSPFLSLNLGFSINSESSNARLNASYYINECGGYVRVPTTISSPEYPQEYPVNMDCVWFVQSSVGSQINVTVTDWGFDGDCNTDYLLIRNGPESTAPEIAKYCNGNSGTDQPKSFISMGNQILVEFHSDAQGLGKGFSLTTQAVEGGCGGVYSQTSAQISSPSYPGPYPSSIECQWQIILPSAYSINMTFLSRFDIQQSEDCTKDYLLIEERWNSEWRTLNRLCGYQRPDSIVSNTSVVQLTFRTDNKTNADGFQLSYKPACTIILTEGHGVLTSPGFPGPYADNLECHYLIQNPDDDEAFINLDFTNFTLENTGQCNFDKLTVYSGSSTTSDNMIGYYCGSDLPPKLASRGSMLLVFTTDSSVTMNGFRAEYGISGCGGTLKRPSGVFHSPNYPLNYPPNVYCVWNITVETDMVLELKFLSFELEQGSCTWDYVIVSDTDGTDLDRFCSTPPVLKSSGNSLTVIFRTDSSYQLKGFRAAYRTTLGEKQGCGGLVTSSSGRIMAPDADNDGMYETDVDCVWRVIGDDDKVLSVTFDVFELEQGSGNTTYPCPYDYIQILDGLTSDSPLIDTFCGEMTPSNFLSTSNRLWIHFHSDDAIVKRGFQLEFTSSPPICGGRLKAQDNWQTLTSPGYPTSFPAGQRCQWNFDLNRTTDRLEIHVLDFDITCGSSYLDLYQFLVVDPSLENMSGPGKPHRLCGHMPYHEIMATNSLSMLLVTGTQSADPTAAGTGFSLQYRIANCSRVYSHSYGFILSPSFPSDHFPDRQCYIAIQAPEGFTISLYFITFVIGLPERYRFGNREIERDVEQRCRSYLKFYDGANSSSPVLDTACGYALVRPVYSTSNRMYIELNRTDSDATRYAITYTTTDKGRGCGGTIIGVNGTFTSPFFPAVYNESSSCVWTVGVPGKHTMTLRFASLMYGSSSGCGDNYLEVFDGNIENESLKLGKFCGEDYIEDLTSQGNQMLVKMVTTTNNSNLVFRAYFHLNEIALTKTNKIVFNQMQSQPSPTEAGVLELDDMDAVMID